MSERSIFRDIVPGIAEWKKYWLGWFVNKPRGVGPSGFQNQPLGQRECVGLS